MVTTVLKEHWPVLKLKASGKLTNSVFTTMNKILKMEKEIFHTNHGPIEYLVSPPGRTGETIVYLHGFGDNKQSFLHAAIHLCRDYQIIIPDLPGFGRSFKNPDTTYHTENYQKWMAAWLDSLKINSAHIVGNSLGGLVSILVTLACPNKVLSLATLNSAGISLEGYPSLYHEFTQGENIFLINNRRDFDHFLKRVFHKKVHIPWPIKETLYDYFLKNKEWHSKLIDNLTAGIDNLADDRVHDISIINRLNQIEAKTLLMWGRHDSLFPYQTAHVMKDQILGAQVHIFDNLGHAPQLESPRNFAKIYKNFLRSP